MKDKQPLHTNKRYYKCLIEEDFYPAPDDRSLKSYIEDIENGDNFADYCEDFFKLLEEEEYYEE